MSLVTGTQTGHLTFRVLSFEPEPPLSESWEEFVEVPISVHDDAQSTEWSESVGYQRDLKPRWYRARYCAIEMDAKHEWDGEMTAAPSEHYRLSFWPTDQSPEPILRCTTRNAEYWHQAFKQHAFHLAQLGK